MDLITVMNSELGNRSNQSTQIETQRGGGNIKKKNLNIQDQMSTGFKWS